MLLCLFGRGFECSPRRAKAGWGCCLAGSWSNGSTGQRLKQEGPSLDDSWVQELMKSAISGFGQLPADQRVEASCCLELDGTLRFCLLVSYFSMFGMLGSIQQPLDTNSSNSSF